MKFPTHRCLLTVLLLAVSATSFAATATFVKKEPAANGKLIYTYRYFCSSGSEGTVTVTAADDTDAKKQADAKSKRVCEE